MNVLKNNFCSVPYYDSYSRSLPTTQRRNLLSAVDIAADSNVLLVEEVESRFSNKNSLEKSEAGEWMEFLFRKVPSHFTGVPRLLAEKEFYRLRKIIEIKQEGLVDKNSSLHVCELIKQIYFQWSDESFLAGGVAINKGSFCFTQEDFCNAEIPIPESFEDQVLMCPHFAFYKLNEQWSKQYIFGGSSVQWPPELGEDPCTFFSGKGYELTNTPLEGDLVVYCDISTKARQPRHFGIWTKTGQVLSKHGNIYVYEHDLAEVVNSYGNAVYFFNKAVKSSLQADFLEKITLFSYPAYASPLTLKGLGESVFEYFITLPIHSYYLNSLYNADYNEELRQLMSERLYHMIAPGTYFESRNEILDGMRQITLSVSRDIKPRF